MAKREINKINHHLSRYRNISDIVIAKGSMLSDTIGNDTHNGETGSSKENALIEIIKDVLPDSVDVVSGLIIDSEAMPIADFLNGHEPVYKLSTQQDILVLKPNALTSFRDNKNVVVPPEYVLATIEVKASGASLPGSNTRLENNKLAQTLSKQRDSISAKYEHIFNGVFYFKTPGKNGGYEFYRKPQSYSRLKRVISNCSFPGQYICFGTSAFLADINSDSKSMYLFRKGENGHYKEDQLAIGYFLSNLLYHVRKQLGDDNPRLEDYLFPPYTKENYSDHYSLDPYVSIDNQDEINKIINV